ncbi:MAG: hypothetical protein ACPG47_07990, partial [Leucothrix sp.]
MSNNRSHFNMACLASVAVLLGACSSTPDVNSSEANELTAAQPSSVKTTTLSQLNDTLVPKTSRPQITKPVIAKRAIVKRKVATRRAVAKKRYTAPKKAYVPPKPIVVAVHKPARPVVKSVAVKPKRVVRKWVKPTSTQQAKRPRANVSVASAVSSRYTPPVTKVASLNKATMPSLPRASAAMVASAPVIRPATVPRSQRKRSVYIAPKSAAASQAATRQQMKAQRQQQLKIQQAQQQQARAQWQKEQKALGYRLKWENDQRAKEQQ